MVRNVDRRRVALVAAGLWMLAILGAACASDGVDEGQATALPTQEPAAEADPWLALIQREPYPYLLPQPVPQRSPLDGTYAKVEHKDVPRVPCKRCPDYGLEAGVWRLHLDRGTFHIFHQETGWRSLGAFVVSRDRSSVTEYPDRLLIFNDPVCPEVVGVYAWARTEEGLALTVIDDTCAIGLRASNLANLEWPSCRPPSAEAGITDHWPKPPGCP